MQLLLERKNWVWLVATKRNPAVSAHALQERALAQRDVAKVAAPNNPFYILMHMTMIRSKEGHMEHSLSSKNGCRQKGGKTSIGDSSPPTIIFDLSNVRKTIIDQINPLVGQGKPCRFFVTQRNVSIDKEGRLMKLGHVNGRVVFKEGGDMGDKRHLLG